MPLSGGFARLGSCPLSGIEQLRIMAFKYLFKRAESMRKIKGFTLIEVMVTLVIVSILAAVGVPSLKEFMDRSKVKAETQRVSGLLALARNHAVTNNQPLIVFGTTVDGVLNVDVYTDGDQDNTLTYEEGTDVYIKRSPGFDASLDYGGGNVVFADNAVQFDSNGRLNEPGPGVLTFCNTDRSFGRQITINVIGRASVSQLDDPDNECL